MSTCAEAIAPTQNLPERLPAVQQTDFVFPISPNPRQLEPTSQAEVVDSLPSLIRAAMANCRRLLLCFHSEAPRLEDVYLTFAGADCQNPDFETMLHWLQERISYGRGSKVSMGIGGSKVVAAIASRVVPPGGECFVPPGREETFLTLVSVQKLRDVVPADVRALADRGITTIGDLRRIPKPVLVHVFGEVPGRALWNAARGRDAQQIRWWKLRSLLVPRRGRGALTSHLGWLGGLFSLSRGSLEALDRVLDRILAVPEEVPPRTTPLS